MKEITDIREHQKIILEIQTKVHDFCERHGIAYSLSGGTCIGAVRHKGFIPWDDDIDVFMTRKHYARFLKKVAEEPIPGQNAGTLFHGLREGRRRSDRTARDLQPPDGNRREHRRVPAERAAAQSDNRGGISSFAEFCAASSC